MAASANNKIWEKALLEYQSKLSQIAVSLSTKVRQQSPSSANNSTPNATIEGIKRLTKLLAIFTTSIPEVSNVVWISVSLIHEVRTASLINIQRSIVNSETRALFLQAIEDISSSIPQFNDYEEVFPDMADVETAMIQFYCKVIDLFLAILDRIKGCSSWTHHIGLLPAPIAINRALKDIETQKEVVQKRVIAANAILQNKRHKEIHFLLSQMAIQARPTSQLPCRDIPYSANSHFHGRQEILDKIKAHLVVSRNERSSFAISGLGGVGKTQIALKYIYDHLEQFPALEPEDSQKDVDAVTTVLKTWLGETKDHWLIVCDNADDLSVLKPFWPPGNQGCIIITSRDPASARVASAGIHVPPFSPLEGETCFVSLLTSRAEAGFTDPHDPALIRRIVKELGYLPLAIVHVSSFIVEHDCTLEEFEDLYAASQQSNQGLWDLEVSTTNLFYEHSLATVWQVSITRLSTNCLKLLRILSYFDPDGVPEVLLWEGAKESDVLSFLRRGLPYFNALHELISRGLNQLFGDALEVLLGAWPVNNDNPFRMNALWPQCSLYLPRVLALETRCRDSPYIKPRVGVIRLFFYASWYLFERRMSELTFPLLQTARGICARNGDSDPFFAKLLTAYGCVCLECDQVPHAAEKFSQVVDCYRKRAEPNDWLLATALSDLGCARTDLGDYARSEQLFSEALRVANAIPGPAGKDWQVHVGHNLSRLLIMMGRPEEALRLQFLQGDEFAGGLIQEDSQRGALFLYGIGNTYLALAQKKGIEGAEERRMAFQYHTRTLKVRTQLCGDHYITGTSLHKVGVLLHEAGDHQSAGNVLQHAITIFDESFNADRELARSLFHFSLVKSDLGEAMEASRLLTEAWQYQERITGTKRNPDIEKDYSLFDKLVLYVHN
ncbi:uncharacterized protein LY89DRAFT_709615 [Mollisia scopiformis]|uniref:NB-ARC domain-containing protein n=1 Tax=Mollisia scopiformis TaxID=149040 RepID=A0A194WWR2_MOLSC|nr:uncharacterized protein LY89DRAFT_709615 [Mollisia scopiformis]KUJ12380.1 hypothetical protein LY89DRAFT_709615 [Mollisia scopiformis]